MRNEGWLLLDDTVGGERRRGRDISAAQPSPITTISHFRLSVHLGHPNFQHRAIHTL